MKQTRYIVDRAGPLLPFLLERVKGGRNHVKGLLARGQVSVDGETVTRHDHPLSPGQVVEVFAQAPAEAPFPVLYEDGRILVVDKPAGLLTVASDGEKVRTAYRLAADYVGRRERGARVFIVHRLDRDTSGVLLFAKDEAVKRAYQEDWNGLVSRRGYLAVAEGPAPAVGHGAHPPAGEFRPSGLLRPGREAGCDPLYHTGREWEIHAAGGVHRHRQEEPDPRPPAGAGLPGGGGPHVRRGHRPPGPAVPPRP